MAAKKAGWYPSLVREKFSIFHAGMREMTFERTFLYTGKKWLALVSAGGALGIFASEDEWPGSKMVPLSIIALGGGIGLFIGRRFEEVR